MRNDLAEAAAEVVGVAKVQVMNDLGSPRGVAGERRNPRKRYESIRS